MKHIMDSMTHVKKPTVTSIRKSFNSFLQEKDLSGIVAVVVTGSVVRGNFFNDWSDIDICILSDSNLSNTTLKNLSSWKSKLHYDYRCKIGLDYINYERLIWLSHNTADVSVDLHYLKHFHATNQKALSDGLVFLKKDVVLPSIDQDKYMNFDLLSYANQLFEWVNETWMRADYGNKDIQKLRITAKACLYLIQTVNYYKTGFFECDYVKLIEDNTEEYDCDLLLEAYKMARAINKYPAEEVEYMSQKILSLFYSIADRVGVTYIQ